MVRRFRRRGAGHGVVGNGGHGYRGTAVAGSAGAARRLPRASTTPGKLRLALAALVIACLGWGALAALTASQHASAATASTVSEPLSLDAQQIYLAAGLALDVTVSTGCLYGCTPAWYPAVFVDDVASRPAAR